ncbi:Dimethylallyl [Hirschfeldia incana]|nr:Dimethylallyl [Hirschfeldia incana]
MASLSIGIAFGNTVRTIPRISTRRSKISCEWDPKGILGPAQTGHIARLEFKRRIERDSEAKEAFQKQLREERERRAALRESRVVPDTSAELIEYFLDTEAQEIEFEIARLRGRLTDEFFAQIRLEIGQIRFAVTKTAEDEDRLIELESLQKALEEGIEAYDKMQKELMTATNSLTKILTSTDIKATLLDMVEKNEINRSLLTLLDENIANAYRGNQKEAGDYMEKVRASVLKYLTV